MRKSAILVVIFALLALCSAAPAESTNWAILVAGSNGYYNYRHQSDICHAYQILKKNGLKEENIIVFMYDDIANNDQNPIKGSIINYSGGPNVYPGVPKDYTKDLVTPKNFLDVLSGKDMTGIGSGKTLKSGPNDKVFIYFSDHGAPGLVAFPGMDMLYAKDLIPVLKKASADKRFDQMVFYIEACESGSMFNKLLSKDLRIYATTASNPFESSYACGYDNTYNAYLNDCYSINFLNDTEQHPITKETLEEQFEHIKKVTNQSHVCQYGDLNISKQPLSNYLASTKSNAFFPARPSNSFAKPTKGMNSRDVKEVYLLKSLEKADILDRPVWQAKYDQYKKEQARSDTIFGAMSSAFNLHYVRDARDAMIEANEEDHCHSEKLDHDCMKDATIAYQEECGKFDEYSIRYITYLRDACNAQVGAKNIRAQLNKICSVVAK
jgi:legumain